MKFKESKYYNKEFLGNNLYSLIYDNSELFTVQEFFNINDEEKEYKKETELQLLYKLKVYDKHYELYLYESFSYGYVIFDKPVHIWDEYCNNIIAPEIIIKSVLSDAINHCVSNKVIINNGYEDSYYYISNSKINKLYFHNEGIFLEKNEINNFFILNKELIIDSDSVFLDYHKIKFFGRCEDLYREISKNKKFKNGIIHIE